MRVRQPRYSKEEFARQAIYEQQVTAAGGRRQPWQDRGD